MKAVRKPGTIVLLLAAFGAGYFAARIVSPSLDSGAASDRDSAGAENRRKGRPAGVAGSSAASGFAHAVSDLERFEGLLARGDFAALLTGERAASAAEEWARNDPEGLWQWLQENETDRISIQTYGTLIATWFRRDADAALEALRLLPSHGRAVAVQSLTSMLFDDDPAVAQAAGARVDEFFGEFVPNGDSGTNPAFYRGRETVEKLQALPASRIKATLLRCAMAGWFGVDWKAARDWAASRSGEERNEMEQGLFGWGLPPRFRGDAEAVAWAAEWLAREENRELRVRLGQEVSGALASDDPAAALAWTNEHLGGIARAEALGSIVATQVRADREAAIALVDGLPPGGVRLRAGRALIDSLANSDSSAAFARALAEESAGFDLGAQCWGRVGTRLGISQPEWAREILRDGSQGAPAIFESRMLYFLASSHPESTLDWTVSEPELASDRRAAIVEEVLRSWRVRDPVAAERWERTHGKR